MKFECSWTELHQAVVDVEHEDDAMESARSLKKNTCIHTEEHGCEPIEGDSD